MGTDSRYIIQKLWNYCNILRDDGISYSDYLEQLSYLLFLKMAHERSQLPDEHIRRVEIEPELDWASLRGLDGPALANHYDIILNTLGKGRGILGIVFRNATNKVQNPDHLRRLIIELIDRETWTALDADVKGDAYEGLLQKNAEDTKSGAGQYFTPRPLVQAIVDVMQPVPGLRIGDPACGTGGFLIAAHDYITKHYGDLLNQDMRHFIKYEAFRGWEIVDSTARMGMMNLFLHGIGGEEEGLPLPICVQDSLRSLPHEPLDMVLTNPPFGRKSTITFTNEKRKSERDAVEVVREDFWARTSNKQLNFIQHISSLLIPGGRAAVVVPDNVLFEDGAGEVVRRNLLRECYVHTLLRLPPGIFYAPGVKANVLFFDRRPIDDSRQGGYLWVYDLRSGRTFTLCNNPLTRAHLEDFVISYCPGNLTQRQECERFRAYSHEELLTRDKVNLDLCWLGNNAKEGTDAHSSPGEIVEAIIADLQDAIHHFKTVIGGGKAG